MMPCGRGGHVVTGSQITARLLRDSAASYVLGACTSVVLVSAPTGARHTILGKPSSYALLEPGNHGVLVSESTNWYQCLAPHVPSLADSPSRTALCDPSSRLVCRVCFWLWRARLCLSVELRLRTCIRYSMSFAGVPFS